MFLIQLIAGNIMPGIVGVISHRSPDECQCFVRAMIASMQHEHFYVSGTCFIPENGIYSGWVAHEDSLAARQLAIGNYKEVTLLFSGECFQPSLSTDQGSTKHQYSDRGINQLLSLYDHLGDRFCEHINGLFSGLLIDRKRKNALLFNDRYGVERIYYFEKDGTIFFASEAKALLRVLPELRGFDDEGVSQFLKFGCTLDGRTLFRNLKILPSGSLWTFDNKVCSRKELYFRPEEWESQPNLTEKAFEIEFMETFRRILPQYLTKDSPIGISLTGGLDTRMIMSCLSNEVIRPVCYTFAGFNDKILDARLAARVAKVCGLEHHILRIGTDFLENYGYHIDRTVFITDGCAGALGAHEIYLNAQARPLSRIRLTGNYGSEILRNVSTLKPIKLADELINKDFNKNLNLLANNHSNKAIHPVTSAAFREIPWSLFGTLAAGRSQLTFRTPYLDNEIVALAFRAPENSRKSPQPALRLVNENNPELSKIPTDRGLVFLGKPSLFHIISRLFSEVTFKLDYLHKEGLPNWLLPLDPFIGSLSRFGLLDLHKFLAYRIWFRRQLANYISEVLTDTHVQKSPYWNSWFLTSILTDHVSGRKNYIREIHTVLTLEATERLLIRGFSDHAGNAP